MSILKSFISAAAVATVASAFTQPGAQTYGALLQPDVNDPVTTGQVFNIQWTPKQPTDGQTVSLVLCNGPSTNCVLQSTAIVEGVAASAGTYAWNVPCSLPSGVQNTATGYGMLIIVDGTGEFQYSTQFSVNAGASCSSSTSSSSTTSASTSSSSSTSMSTTSQSMTTSSSATSSMSSKSSTSSVSGSSTTSASGQPSSSSQYGGWYGWSTSTNSTSVSATATSAAPVSSTWAVWTTSSAPIAAVSSTSAAVMSSASVTPQAYTGAAAVPTAFANVAGVVGAAVLGMMAL